MSNDRSSKADVFHLMINVKQWLENFNPMYKWNAYFEA